jgi:tetratricopeptide (TPR) repeat protein
MVNRFVELDKKGWYALQLKGYVLREAGKFDDAIDTYLEVIKRIEKDKTLKGDEQKRIIRNARYVMTSLYVDSKKIDEAAKILEELIKEEPDAATYYNDLGFIWADNDMKMEESEKLIRKAIELDEQARQKAFKEGKIDEEASKKANAAYLDSLGWVLYKNKKYDEAKKYLLESIKDDEEGAHMEIWDHLADVYLAQGDTKLAIETWQKALKFEDISKRDAERRKKITEKLKKAKADLKK